MAVDWFDVVSTGGVNLKSNASAETRTAVKGVKAVVSYGGASATTYADIAQKAGAKVWGALTIKNVTVSDVPAKGGKASDYVNFTVEHAYTWNGDSNSAGVDTYTRQQLPSGYTVTIENDVTAPSLGTTVKARSKITGAGFKITVGRTPVAGSNATVTVNVYQAANAATYATPVVALSVADIPASGGSRASGTVSYTQAVSYTSTSSQTLTSGGTVSYSAAISAASLGATIKARTSIGTLTATVTMNGKAGSSAVAVYQAANAVVAYGAPYAKNLTIPNSGVSVDLRGQIWQKHTYTSGSAVDKMATGLTSSTFKKLSGILGTIDSSQGNTWGFITDLGNVGDALIRANVVNGGTNYALDIIIFGPPVQSNRGVVLHQLNNQRFADYSFVTITGPLSSDYDLDRDGISIQGFHDITSISGTGITKSGEFPYISVLNVAAGATGRVVFSSIESPIDVVLYINMTKP